MALFCYLMSVTNKLFDNYLILIYTYPIKKKSILKKKEFSNEHTHSARNKMD